VVLKTSFEWSICLFVVVVVVVVFRLNLFEFEYTNVKHVLKKK